MAAGKPLTLYVATNGDDHWSGDLSSPNRQKTDGPLYSPAAAIDRSREARREGAPSVRILLHGGTYDLSVPLLLTADDSKVEIAAFGREEPVLSGRIMIHGWKVSARNPNIWETTIPDVRSGNWIFHELFVNGRRKPRTRVPEAGFYPLNAAGMKGRPTELQFSPGEIKAEWAQPGDVELVAYSHWAQARNQIRDVLAGSNIVSLAGQALANDFDGHPRFFIENAPVELHPGQWRVDSRTGVLSYWPDAGEDVARAVVTAPHLYDLLQIKGDSRHPAHDIAIRGITFADTDWHLDGGSDIDIQNAVEVPGAVRAEFARECVFERCAFERLGGFALELDKGCQRDKIIGNEMRDLGAGGIRIGSTDMDEAMFSACGGHLISDNHIHDIGLVNAPAAGILVFLSAKNDIAHNEIDHTFETGIAVGWSWGYALTPCRDNIVECNSIHDIGQGLLSDMAGVYTLGVQPGTIIRSNLIHDVADFSYGGWGLYTDEGSSDIVLEDNIVYRCQSAGFHQHYGHANIIRHNIFALNRDAQLARTRIESWESFVFTNNIVYFDSGALFAGNWGNDLKMDRNIYFDTRPGPATRDALRAWQKRGHDVHSLLADPLFVAPRKGDFRLRANSPARAFGFAPLDLSGVGVRAKHRRAARPFAKSLTRGAGVIAYWLP